MQMRTKLFAAAVLAAATFATIPTVYSADAVNKSDGQSPDQAAQAVDRAANNAGQAADRTTDHTNTQGVARDARAGMASVALPAGIEAKDLHEENDIRGSLEGVSKQALNKNDFDNVVGYLVDADRTRVKEYKVVDSTKMDGRIDQIQKVWQQKYNKDFAIDGKNNFTEAFAVIMQGEVVDPQRVAQSWPVPANAASMMQDRAQPAAARQEGDRAADADKTFGGKTNLEKGRNVAIVAIAPSHGMADLNLSMIHELPDTWRFDIPDNISGEQLYNNLLTQLTYIGEHADQWPADVNDAQRMLAHHVAMALYGIEPGAAAMGDHMNDRVNMNTDRMNNATDRATNPADKSANTDRMNNNATERPTTPNP